MAWYEQYFGEDYFRADAHRDTALEVEGLSLLIGPPEETRVLDLACGYGRHSVPLAGMGYRIVGYDLSDALLRRARKCGKEVAWVRGDLRALPFHGWFDAAINMFTAFGYFEGEDENFTVLQEMEAVLKPGGRFILQLVNRDYLVRTFQPQEIRRVEDLLVLEERTFDVAGSRVQTTTTVIEGTRRRTYESSIRVYTLTELDMLLAAAGLYIREVFGGLDQRPYDWNTNQLIIVAEKPAPVRQNA